MHASPRDGVEPSRVSAMVPFDFRRNQNESRRAAGPKAPAASERCNPQKVKSRRPRMASVRTLEGLVAIMDRLRDPGGCPWDREQTYATLRGYLIEECYEVVDALDRADLPALCEELGDLQRIDDFVALLDQITAQRRV